MVEGDENVHVANVHVGDCHGIVLRDDEAGFEEGLVALDVEGGVVEGDVAGPAGWHGEDGGLAWCHGAGRGIAAHGRRPGSALNVVCRHIAGTVEEVRQSFGSELESGIRWRRTRS
jgi:hypothetical protein